MSKQDKSFKESLSKIMDDNGLHLQDDMTICDSIGSNRECDCGVSGAIEAIIELVERDIIGEDMNYSSGDDHDEDQHLGAAFVNGRLAKQRKTLKS